MIYRVKDWSVTYENNKSRERESCSYVCVPNKQHGMGFCRIMNEKDGAAIYGIWIMILAACSQQKVRGGWLTEGGVASNTPWTPEDLSLKFRRPVEEITRALEVLTSERVGWIEVVSADRVPAECPPDAIEEKRREEKGIEEKEGLNSMACLVIDHLNAKAGRSYRYVEANTKAIELRLSEVGRDLEGVKRMIDRQCALWKGDPEMDQFLRPETLFRPSKFNNYYDNRNLPVRPVKQQVRPSIAV